LTVNAVESLNENIVQLEYNPPEFKNFFVRSLGAEKRYREGNTTVHEMRYLLIPQKKGKITVPPASVKIGTRSLKAPKDPFGIFKPPLKWNSIRSASVHLTVKPLSSHTILVGHYSVKCSVDKHKARKNKPVSYTLTISGEGSLEDMDDPEFNIDNVTVYSDDAQIKSKIKNGKMYSSYAKKYVFISDRDFTIPALSFGEFDYTTGKNLTLRTDPIPIKVSGGGTAAGRQRGGRFSHHGVAPKTERKPVDPLEDTLYYTKREYEERMEHLPWYIAAAFAAGMITMFLLTRLPLSRFRQRFKDKGFSRHYSSDEALKILYPHTNEGKEVEEMVRQLYEIECGNRSVKINQKLLHRLIARYVEADRDQEENMTSTRKRIFHNMS